MTQRETALKIAWHYLGTPYIWGGDDFSGFDCSGLMVEILKSVGALPRGGDWTASGLWKSFKDKCQVKKPGPGCMVFWSNRAGAKIIHVEMCLDDKLSIGASGGGSKTKTEQDAVAQNAFIKIRPFRSRNHIFGFIDPFNKEGG